MSSLFSPNYSSAKFPEPREFQNTAHEKLRQGFKDGHRCQLLMAPTGGGKTYLGMRIIHEALQRGKKTIFVCDRTTLINQTSAVADSYGLAAHSIVQAGHWRFDSRSNFQIASVQTLARRSWPDADVIVIDECFPAGTKISTKDGEKNIEDLNSGDLVYNGCGESYIISVFSKLTYATINVRLSDGSNIECTAEHPIFTDTGWRPASALARGSRVYRKEDLQSLWEAFQPENIVDRETCRTSCSGISFQQASMLRKILREEIEESNALPRSKAKSFKKIKKNRAQAKSENGEWRWNDEAASHNEASSWCGMDSRICGKDTKKPYRWLSASLQDRFSESCLEDCYRAGRSEPLFDEKKGAGQKEGLSSSQPWVESIEIIEYPSGISVYNLRVAGHPSYFANGILVHNCHTQYKAWTEHIKNTDAVVFGLSATPFSQGLGRLFTNLINAATMHELTQSGVLVPMRVFSCTKINMEGAETSGGEWKDSAAAQRGMEIVGDVITEWQKHAENRKTIIFGATIAHCLEMCRQFNESGIPAAAFTSDTTESDRKELLDEFSKPDSFYRILLSVEALAKGFDVKDVGCVGDCRPLRKSLSTAIQMWGRGLRSSPETGKQDCILLDFSGNIIRFADDFSDVFYNGLESLDMGEKLDKTIRRDNEEKEESKCPSCGFSPFGKRCISCGHERQKQNLVDHLPGEMTEIMIGKSKLADDRKHLYEQVCTYTRSHGNPETARQRAWYLFQDLAGCKPSPFWKFEDQPNTQLTRNTLNHIKRKQIAFAKANQRRQA